MQGVVAAGATAVAELRECGVERVPLLTINGETILTRICRCLIEGGGCDTVYVLAPENVPLPDIPAVRRADYSGALVDDSLRCYQRDITSDNFLFACADVPLLSNESIAEVVRVGQETGADLIYPVVERKRMEEMFPGGKRTYVPLRNGRFTGGNVFWINRNWVLDRRDILLSMFENRKNVPALAATFGMGFIFRLLFRMADLHYVEQHLSRILKGNLHAAPMQFPELAADLDKLADLELFRPHLDDWSSPA